MVAMIICDQIITEQGSNKKSLIGCFNNIYAHNFPCVHPTFFVFIALTNGRGEFKTKLKMINETTNTTVFEVGGGVVFQDPMKTVEIAFKLVNLTFQSAGSHAIQFLCDDELLMVRKIEVLKISKS